MKRLRYIFKNLKSKKRLKIFGKFAKGIIYESENGTIAMPIQDITIGKKLGFKGQWDITEVNKIANKCNKKDNIYVIGTHVGTLLVPLTKHVKHIFGYEANADTFWFVNKNISLNNITNTTLFNFAVGDEEKQITFYKSKVNTGGSKIKPAKKSLRYIYDNPDEVSVPMIALDEHIKTNNLPEPSGFIIDIEGAEFAALKGMQHNLSKARFLYIEFVPHHLKNVANVHLKTFMELITPHFNVATFIKNDKTFLVQSQASEFFTFLNYLEKNNFSDDILFEKKQKLI